MELGGAVPCVCGATFVFCVCGGVAVPGVCGAAFVSCVCGGAAVSCLCGGATCAGFGLAGCGLFMPGGLDSGADLPASLCCT